MQVKAPSPSWRNIIQTLRVLLAPLPRLEAFWHNHEHAMKQKLYVIIYQKASEGNHPE